MSVEIERDTQNQRTEQRGYDEELEAVTVNAAEHQGGGPAQGRYGDQGRRQSAVEPAGQTVWGHDQRKTQWQNEQQQRAHSWS